MSKKHYCKAVDHPQCKIFCISVPDSDRFLDLVWLDGSRLLVEYCPFCGLSASEAYKETMTDYEKNEAYDQLLKLKAIPVPVPVVQQYKQWVDDYLKFSGLNFDIS